MSFLAGLAIGILFTLLVSLALGSREIARLRKNHKVVLDRFEAATVELELHLKRLDETHGRQKGKDALS